MVAAIVGGALMWPPSFSFLRDTLPFDLLGLDTLGVEYLIAGLFGLAAVLLPLAFGADITGS
jgi:hypothetical protein